MGHRGARPSERRQTARRAGGACIRPAADSSVHARIFCASLVSRHSSLRWCVRSCKRCAASSGGRAWCSDCQRSGGLWQVPAPEQLPASCYTNTTQWHLLSLQQILLLVCN